jgi:hypothetical protein
LDKEIYLDMPPFLDVNENQRLTPGKTIYDLCKSNREFKKNLIKVLRNIGLIGDKSIHCLWTKWESKSKVL